MTNYRLTTITVTETNGDVHTIEDAVFLGVIAGQFCIRKVESHGKKVVQFGSVEIPSERFTYHDMFVPMGDVVSVIVDECGDGGDTYEEVGQHFNEDFTALAV